MKTVSLSDLYDCDYVLNTINGMKQTQKEREYFDCMGNPKQLNLIVYLDGCKAEYTLKDGEVICGESGDMIHTPRGSEYSVRFYDFESPKSGSIGVNFLIFDKYGIPLVLDDKIQIIRADNINYKAAFEDITRICESNSICYGKLKSRAYALISALCEQDRKIYAGKYDIIEKGIDYLENDRQQSLSISEIAALCNVSEIYFRKLFKQYRKESPNEYRINARITKAKSMLRDDLNVKEVSDRLGYTSTSYFIKTFKKKTGMTPLEFKNNRQ